MVEIQVKTARNLGLKSNWPVGAKAQQLALSEREWFAFVLLPAESPWHAPRTFIVPRDHVAAATWIVHQSWLTDPTAPAGQRNAPVEQARVNVEVWVGYENRWDVLNEPAYSAPVLLPEWVRDLAQEERVGLPPGHAWEAGLPDW
jgi:hypothetical protein